MGQQHYHAPSQLPPQPPPRQPPPQPPPPYQDWSSAAVTPDHTAPGPPPTQSLQACGPMPAPSTAPSPSQLSGAAWPPQPGSSGLLHPLPPLPPHHQQIQLLQQRIQQRQQQQQQQQRQQLWQEQQQQQQQQQWPQRLPQELTWQGRGMPDDGGDAPRGASPGPFQTSASQWQQQPSPPRQRQWQQPQTQPQTQQLQQPQRRGSYTESSGLEKGVSSPWPSQPQQWQQQRLQQPQGGQPTTQDHHQPLAGTRSALMAPGASLPSRNQTPCGMSDAGFVEGGTSAVAPSGGEEGVWPRAGAGAGPAGAASQARAALQVPCSPTSRTAPFQQQQQEQQQEPPYEPHGTTLPHNQHHHHHRPPHRQLQQGPQFPEPAGLQPQYSSRGPQQHQPRSQPQPPQLQLRMPPAGMDRGGPSSSAGGGAAGGAGIGGGGGAREWRYYHFVRLQTTANHILFYLVDQDYNAELAVVVRLHDCSCGSLTCTVSWLPGVRYRHTVPYKQATTLSELHRLPTEYSSVPPFYFSKL
ncbi:hypothetical protein PLESTM_001166600 [Pleodorina starrii]|nr:hypothetical protein PLESTM_001166600 [Pleodorina starrii]